MNARTQTLGEEIANSVSHGAALLAAIAALPFLVVAARQQVQVDVGTCCEPSGERKRACDHHEPGDYLAASGARRSRGSVRCPRMCSKRHNSGGRRVFHLRE